MTIWLGLWCGAFTCVEWQVCDPIWQVTLRLIPATAVAGCMTVTDRW